MRAFVEGSEISSTKSFYVPSMLLSSYHPGGQGLVCRLEISKSELLEVLQEPYDQLVEELRRDDEATGETDSFGKAGYPPLVILLEEPQLLLEVFDTYLADDFFTLVQLRDSSEPSGYFIRQFTSSSTMGDFVVFDVESLPLG
jgi:hypothetical protein